jgi:hypothetical protein
LSRIAAHRRRSVIHEVDQACTAAESLDAHRSRAGVEIGEDSALDTRARTLKRVSRRRSLVGRVASPRGAISRRERYVPPITRIGFDGK